MSTRQQPIPLKGKVAQVINERELAINIGRTHGVELGMRFAVLAESPVEIRDPETQEVLGTHDIPKVHVKVTSVNDKYAVCRTYQYRTIGGGLDFGLTSSIREMMGPQQRIYETFDATKESFPAPLSQEDSYVSIGDRVEQVLGDDE